MRRPLVAGNWKMNTRRESATALAEGLARRFDRPGAVDVMVAPPFPYLDAVAGVLDGSAVALGAQDAWHAPDGACTGEVSLEMLIDVGCRWVIVGHSERRHVLGEADSLVATKLAAAIAAGCDTILCVGELLEQRDEGRTEEVLDTQLESALADLPEHQLEKLVIAYEPVWAIGTGRTATPEQAESAHEHLRNRLASRYNPGVAERVRLLYGGSVNPDNARALLEQPDVDGALVGGASLAVESFIPIVEAAS